MPLLLVLAYVARQGLPTLAHLEFFQNIERPVGIPGGGEAQAIAGTLIIVGLASIGAIPLGILGGIFLAEREGALADQVRLATDVLVAAPSIAVGLFAYTAIVAPTKSFSALSGSVALALLMLPIVTRSAEVVLLLVPDSLREAALALGAPRWRVVFRVVLPTAMPGIVTGSLLAVARGAGETAPLLFTAFAVNGTNWDLSLQMNSLPVQIFTDVRQPQANIVERAWGAALTLVAMILLLTLIARLIQRRSRLTR